MAPVAMPAVAAGSAAAQQAGASHVTPLVSTAALLAPHGHTPREVTDCRRGHELFVYLLQR